MNAKFSIPRGAILNVNHRNDSGDKIHLQCIDYLYSNYINNSLSSAKKKSTKKSIKNSKKTTTKKDNSSKVTSKQLTIQASELNPILRPPAEEKYSAELDYLESIDTYQKPINWYLSPQLLKIFILGSQNKKFDIEIEQKFYGDESLVERAIVTLASDRGLLLIGTPGTGKSWLAELLAAGISRNSKLVVQGTSATTEDQIKYSWNIAQVIANGQSSKTMIASPIMKAMKLGSIGRFEELTRCTSDVQDALISLMSEKYISIPEIETDNLIFAERGFNIIATANSRDKGVNELSSALKRRFNFVTIPVVTNSKIEKDIIQFRLNDLLISKGFETEIPVPIIDMLLETFNQLRKINDSTKLEADKLESSLSTAEQIAILEDTVLQSNFFDSTSLPKALAQSLIGSLTRRIPEDYVVINKFWSSFNALNQFDEFPEFKKEGVSTLKKYKVN